MARQTNLELSAIRRKKPNLQDVRVHTLGLFAFETTPRFKFSTITVVLSSSDYFAIVTDK